MSTNKILAWHFVGETLRDGRPVPPDGQKLIHPGKVILCHSGFHGSMRITDALKYAPGGTLCRTEHGGRIVYDDDKFASSDREILWRIDATKVLLKFARLCALDVARLWDMPAVVREYLETGNETKQGKAMEAVARAARAGTWAAHEAVAAEAAVAAVEGEAAVARAARAGTWAAHEAVARAAAWAMEAAAEAARAAANKASKEMQEARLVGMVEDYRLTGRA